MCAARFSCLGYRLTSQVVATAVNTHTHIYIEHTWTYRLVIILPLLLSAAPFADFLAAALEGPETASIEASRNDSTVHQQSDIAVAKYYVPYWIFPCTLVYTKPVRVVHPMENKLHLSVSLSCFVLFWRDSSLVPFFSNGCVAQPFCNISYQLSDTLYFLPFEYLYTNKAYVIYVNYTFGQKIELQSSQARQQLTQLCFFHSQRCHLTSTTRAVLSTSVG